MSLYNTLFGVNPCAGNLLKIVGTDPLKVPRFRDCFLKGDAIMIYTRVGGGNREDYPAQIAYLRSLPGFLTDHDDTFDRTFAYFSYSIPKAHARECDLLRELGAERDPAEEWRRLLAKIKDPAMKNDPEVLAAMEKMRPAMDKLEAAMKGDGPPIVEV